ncbi:hypothetical protein [Caldiplasma sukawensis]
MRFTELENHWYEIFVESDDDLWYIKTIIGKNSRIHGTVLRREEQSQDIERTKEIRRKPVEVTIMVEECEFKAFSDKLRVFGVIVDGPENLIGSHQALNIEKGMSFRFYDEKIGKFKENILKEAVLRNVNDALVVFMDDEVAEIYMIKSYGNKKIGTIYSEKTGKEYNSSYRKEDYFLKIEKIIRSTGYHGHVIITGTGFEGRNFLEWYKDRDTSYLSGLWNFPSSSEGESAIYEIISKEEVRKIIGNNRQAEESWFMERFLSELSKDGRIAYGKDEVRKYAEASGIEEIAVIEEMSTNEHISEIIEMALNAGSKIITVSKESKYHDQIKSFGGIIALIRFKF